jgi:histidine triad (HIT) family protein
MKQPTDQNNCVFCKIVAGEIPSYKIYEDTDYYAFLDIYPRVKGHTLLIPKKHYRWVYDVPDFGEYWERAKKITDAILPVIKPDFVEYITYGLHVPHAHIHIMPRQKTEPIVPQRKKFPTEEMNDISKKIRVYLE